MLALLSIGTVTFMSCGKETLIEKNNKKISSVKSYASMEEVFNSSDTQALKSSDEIIHKAELMNLSIKISNFIKNNYNQNFSPNINEDYMAVIIMGIGYLANELNGNIVHLPDGKVTLGGQTEINNNNFGDCLITTFMSIIGVKDVMGLVNDFKNGVSPNTILKTGKVMARRVATAFTVAIALVEFGDCMEWW